MFLEPNEEGPITTRSSELVLDNPEQNLDEHTMRTWIHKYAEKERINICAKFEVCCFTHSLSANGFFDLVCRS